MWAKFIQFIRSSIFKAEIKNGDFEVKHSAVSNHTKVWTVSSFGGLKEMVLTNPSSSIGINIIAKGQETGIIIPTTTGDVYIPNNADGTLTVGEGSASLHLTTYTGEVFHLFYNEERDIWVKGLISAENSKYLSGGWTYEGEVNVGGDGTLISVGKLNMNWGGTDGELYAVKLVDKNKTSDTTYSFMLANERDSSQMSRSNVSIIRQGKYWKHIRVQHKIEDDVPRLAIVVDKIDGDDTTPLSAYTFEVYWKKIF